MATKRVLGAVIVGGKSTRFGSDKALAEIGGRPMLDHVVDALRLQVDAVVICGRKWRTLRQLADKPGPGLGPLGGLNAALQHGAKHGYDAVLSVPVDVLPVPPDLLSILGERGPAILCRQHLIGLWPTALAGALDRHVGGGGRRVRDWITFAGARLVDHALVLDNINFREDLGKR